MQTVLGVAGEQGWQLVGVYDKASNWSTSMEKGFMMLRRPVPAGVRLGPEEWCIALNLAGLQRSPKGT
jgi:hypothetical protein